MSDQDELLKICSALQWGFLGVFLVSLLFIYVREIPSIEYAVLSFVLTLSFAILPRFLADPVSGADDQ